MVCFSRFVCLVKWIHIFEKLNTDYIKIFFFTSDITLFFAIYPKIFSILLLFNLSQIFQNKISILNFENVKIFVSNIEKSCNILRMQNVKIGVEFSNILEWKRFSRKLHKLYKQVFCNKYIEKSRTANDKY